MPPVLVAAALTAGAAVYGSTQAKKAADKTLTAQNQASQQQLAAQQGAFNTVVGLQQPFQQGGVSAFNALLAKYGLAPQGGTQPGGTGGTGVIGSQGFGGYGGGTSMGPAPAQPTQDWAGYLQANPDVMAEYQRASQTADRNSPAYAEHGLDSPEAYAQWHYQNYGQAEGRTVPMTGGDAPPVVEPPAPTEPQPATEPVAPQGPPDLMHAERPTYTRPDAMAEPDYGSGPDLASYFSNFQEDPGAAYRKSEALNGVNAYSAARGKLRSGDAAKALATLGSNLASQEYGNWFNRQLQRANLDQSAYQNARNFKFADYQYGQNRADNVYNDDRNFGNTNFNTDRSYQTGREDTQIGNLFNLAQIGQNAAGAVSGAAGNYANNSSNIFGSQANAASDAAYARANANAGLFGSLAGVGSNLATNGGFGSNPYQSTAGSVNLGSYSNPFGRSPVYQPVF